jgi:hypothetical protein
LKTAGRALALVLLVACAAPVAAQAGTADRIADTFTAMADDLVKAFQPVEGMVLERDGDRIFIDIGEEAGAQVGQELTIFRKGDVFRHPVTGKPLGRYEEVLGYAQVKRVLPRLSEAVFIPVPERPEPRAEDGARISRGRLRVAIAPVLDLAGLGADVRRVPYLFATMLERSKRFQVVDPILVSDTIAKQNVRIEEILGRPDRAVPLGRTLEISGWVVPIIVQRGGVTYLDTTWVSAITGTALFYRRDALKTVGAQEEQRFPWEPVSED